MKKLNQFITLILVITNFGCSKVDFKKDETFNKCQNFPQSCTRSGGYDIFDYSIQTAPPQVDILIVDDNSGSMYIKQQRMGASFPNFIQSLKNIDYHIGIVTTDISTADNPNRAINKNGALQDGFLIEFSQGLKYITSSTTNSSTLFTNTIQRNETLSCAQEGFAREFCPSFDERAIYSAWEAINRNENSFIRTSAHLALIILSDEDERSNGGLNQGYELQDKDLAKTLVSLVDTKFEHAKTFSVHSIIVNPNDSDANIQSCLNFNATHGQPSLGSFIGTTYAHLSEITKGTTGSICADDYGQEVGNIGAAIVERVKSIKIACIPDNKQITITFEPQPTEQITYTLDASTKEIHFDKGLPAGTNIRLQYSCPELP